MPSVSISVSNQEHPDLRPINPNEHLLHQEEVRDRVQELWREEQALFQVLEVILVRWKKEMMIWCQSSLMPAPKCLEQQISQGKQVLQKVLKEHQWLDHMLMIDQTYTLSVLKLNMEIPNTVNWMRMMSGLQSRISISCSTTKSKNNLSSEKKSVNVSSK